MSSRQPAYSHLVAVAVLCLLAGCTATISGVVKAPDPPDPGGVFRAGAARVDITPPPGYPMGGHSIAGRVGRGVWLRLFARSIFLEDPSGVRLVLVSADLWSVPAGLSDRVSEIVSDSSPDCSPGRAGIILAATHTHQSPANFSSSPLYNAFASPHAGFDPDLFEFLARRIARSVREACKEKEPAVLLFNTTRMLRTPFARNRSLEAFLENPEAGGIMRENADLPIGVTSPLYPSPLSYQAIDPALKVLRVARADDAGRVLALAAFLAVHPTSLTHDAGVYSSDLFGAAALLSEAMLPAGGSGRRPVVAIFNGAEGDVSPAWTAQDRRDTVRLGEELANEIMGLGPGQRVEERIDYQYGVRALAGACLKAGDGSDFCTDTAPLAGVAMLGGAEDGRTFFSDLGWREGVTGHFNIAQGRKKPAFDLIPLFPPPLSPTRLIGQIYAAPRTVPVGVYTIGQLALATLPGEFTTVMGKRIARRVRESIKPPVEDVILVGPANEYVSYFTTPEEYDVQAYEGASTLYGKASGPVVAHEIGLLAERIGAATRGNDELRFAYNAGPVRRFGIDRMSLGNSGIPGEGLSHILQDPDTGLPSMQTLPAFCWDEPSRSSLLNGSPDSPAVPSVAVEEKLLGIEVSKTLVTGGLEETDRGLNFATVVMGRTGDMTSWCTFWMPARETREKSLAFRFRVTTAAGTTIRSSDCFIDRGVVSTDCRFSQRQGGP